MNTQPIYKMTLVSMWINGKLVNGFVRALYVDGKAYVDPDVWFRIKHKEKFVLTK